MTKSTLICAVAVFIGSLAFLLLLAPLAPFTKELGVLESSAVRDIFAGHVILPSFAPYEPGSQIQAPPLSWWTDALMVRLLGWNEIAFRLPAVVSSAATCALLFLWLAEVTGYRAGFLGAASLLFCHFFADAARQPRMDAMLTMFVTASAVCLERALFGAPHRRRLLLLVAAILMALGTMTKGPLGPLLPGLAIGAYCLVTRRLRELFKLDVIAAFLGSIVIVMPWYIAAYQIGGKEFLDWQIYGVLFHRFMSSEIFGRRYCPNPFYYFVPIALAGFFPWSIYLPALAVWFWRRGVSLPDPAIFALCWFSAIFIFFSSSTGKCFEYILPVFPPLAAMLGLLIERMNDPSRDFLVARTFGLGSAVLGIGILLLGLSMIVILLAGAPSELLLHLHPRDREYISIFSSVAGHPAFVLFLLAWVGGGLLLLLGSQRTLLGVQLTGAVAVAAAGIAFWFGVMNPALSQRQSLKGFAKEVDSVVPLTAKINFIGQMDYDFAFYSNRGVEHAGNFDCGAPRDGQRYFLVAQDEYGKLGPARTGCVKLIAKSPAVDHHGARLLFVTDSNSHRM